MGGLNNPTLYCVQGSGLAGQSAATQPTNYVMQSPGSQPVIQVWKRLIIAPARHTC